MRKVKFKIWIPVIRVKAENGIGTIIKKGTCCFEKKYSQNGFFHQWANNYDEYENGAGNYTVALVELEDGTISEVKPENLKFIDKLDEGKSSNEVNDLKNLLSTVIGDMYSLSISGSTRTEFSEELQGCIENWKDSLNQI